MAKRSTARPGRSRLPSRLRQLFWDYNFARLSWRQDQDLIVARVLAAGDWKAITWLRRRVGDTGLRDWLMRRDGAGLSPQQLRFWELILGLPHRCVNAWLARPERQTWDRRRHA